MNSSSNNDDKLRAFSTEILIYNNSLVAILPFSTVKNELPGIGN